MRHLRFHRSLYEEHLEEISILYGRRSELLNDPDATPEDPGELEARLDAHLDALVVGGDAALALCLERAATDPGTLFGAVGLIARQHRPDCLPSVVAQLQDLDDEEGPDPEAPPLLPPFAVALSDALRFEAPADWAPLLGKLLLEGQPVTVAAMARVAGYRRLPLGPSLVTALGAQATPYCLRTLLWAVGRVREVAARPLLVRHAQEGDADTVATACLALLRLGDPGVRDYLVQLLPFNHHAPLLLAIGGRPDVLSVIHGRLAQGEPTAEDVLAAALHGDPATLPWLLDLLERRLHPESVAEALYLLTGAPLFETVDARTEPIDPLADEDPRDLVKVKRLAQDPRRWRDWWEAHGGGLAIGVRHRLGRPASPVMFAEALHCFALRRSVRELIADELDLHYGPQWTVDVDTPVAWQHAALARLRDLNPGPPSPPV